MFKIDQSQLQTNVTVQRFLGFIKITLKIEKCEFPANALKHFC